MIEYTLVLMRATLILAIVISCFGVYIYNRNKIFSILIMCVVLLMIVAISLIYPTHTIPYQNGYRDYPNNTTYNQVKIINDQSIWTNEYTWYCMGYEKAQIDNTKIKIQLDHIGVTEETKQKIYRNITRHD